MITDVLIALTSLFNPIFALFGIPTLLSRFNSVFTFYQSSGAWNTIKPFFSLLFYFIPINIVITLIGISLGILLLRFAISIISEIWVG